MLPGRDARHARCTPDGPSLDVDRAQPGRHAQRLQQRLDLRRHRQAHLDAPHRPRAWAPTSSSPGALLAGRHHLRRPRGAQRPPRPRRRHFTIETTHLGTTRVTGSDGATTSIDVAHDRRATRTIEGDGGNDTVTSAPRPAWRRRHDRPDRRAADDRRRRRRRHGHASTTAPTRRATSAGSRRRRSPGLDLVAPRRPRPRSTRVTRPARRGFTITILGVGAAHVRRHRDRGRDRAGAAGAALPDHYPATASASCGTRHDAMQRSCLATSTSNVAVGHGRDCLIGFRGERNAGVGAIPLITVDRRRQRRGASRSSVRA